MRMVKCISTQTNEYVITYGVKLYLLENSWDVIAYNPPGSQGTFTIPNPSKDGSEKGQTGSESPDVIAVKDGHVLIVECKPKFDLVDAQKLNRLSNNELKMEVLDLLIRRVCKANDIPLPSELNYIYALAYQGDAHGVGALGFINVEVAKEFDIRTIPARNDFKKYFKSIVTPALAWEPEALLLFEN
jgi:hypothetical protein